VIPKYRPVKSPAQEPLDYQIYDRGFDFKPPARQRSKSSFAQSPVSNVPRRSCYQRGKSVRPQLTRQDYEVIWAQKAMEREARRARMVGYFKKNLTLLFQGPTKRAKSPMVKRAVSVSICFNVF
jgi:hypothetical protein